MILAEVEQENIREGEQKERKRRGERRPNGGCKKVVSTLSPLGPLIFLNRRESKSCGHSWEGIFGDSCVFLWLV